MNVWRGQTYLAIAVLFVLGAVLNGLLGYMAGEGLNGAAKALLYAFAGICVVGALVSSALSYAQWVPKWERDRRLAGEVPGERKER